LCVDGCQMCAVPTSRCLYPVSCLILLTMLELVGIGKLTPSPPKTNLVVYSCHVQITIKEFSCSTTLRRSTIFRLIALHTNSLFFYLKMVHVAAFYDFRDICFVDIYITVKYVDLYIHFHICLHGVVLN
jgi:hypothetical protein